MRVSEIRVNQIRVNQGLGVYRIDWNKTMANRTYFSRYLLKTALNLNFFRRQWMQSGAHDENKDI